MYLRSRASGSTERERERERERGSECVCVCVCVRECEREREREKERSRADRHKPVDTPKHKSHQVPSPPPQSSLPPAVSVSLSPSLYHSLPPSRPLSLSLSLISLHGQQSRFGNRTVSTEGPSWGHSRVVLGAIGSFLEPFCGYLSPKIDKVSEELTFDIPPRRALRGLSRL